MGVALAGALVGAGFDAVGGVVDPEGGCRSTPTAARRNAVEDTGLVEPGDEVVLEGGAINGGRVVRVGDEVRRPQQPSGPAVRALLGHLAANGFEAPVHLDIDDRGRDRFSYVPGDVAVPPFPVWVLEEHALVSAARLLRRLHSVTSTMAAADLPWDEAFADPTGPVVGHNDVCPENTVFREGRAVAFIDFDLAAPTDPLLDLAHLLRMWVPLGVAEGPDRTARLRTRMRAGAAGYGVDRGPLLQQALDLSVDRAERFVRARLDRPDLTADFFARRRGELVEAAADR